MLHTLLSISLFLYADYIIGWIGIAKTSAPESLHMR